MAKKLLSILTLSLLCSVALASRLPPIKPGTPGQKRGDIIAPMLDEQVAAWCDFDKQIIVTRTNILCAYVGNESQLNTSAKTPKNSAKQLAAASKPTPKDLTPNLYEMSEYGET